MNLQFRRAVLSCLVLLVSLCCSASAQSPISAVPAQIAVATVQGHSDYRVEIQLSSGASDTAWTVEADQPWIGVDPVSGATPATLSVKLDASQLAPGVHTGTITLSAAGQSTVTVPVRLLVEPLAILALKSNRSSATVYGLSYQSKFYGGSGQAYLVEFDSAARTIRRVLALETGALDFAIHEAEGRIYVSYQNSPLQALDIVTLQKMRSYPFPSVRPGAGAKGQLYMAGTQEGLRLLDTDTGEILATQFNAPGTGEPSPSGNNYYINAAFALGREIRRYEYVGGGFLEWGVTPRKDWNQSRVIVVSDDGQRVFWCGECFDSFPRSQWVIGEAIFAVSAGGHMAFGDANVYDVDARRRILGMPKNVTAMAYNISSETLVVVADSKVKFLKFDPLPTLSPPVLSVGRVSGFTAQINWTEDSLETSFTLQRRLKGAEEWQDVSSAIVANTTTYAFDNLQPQQGYEFRIRAEAPEITSEWSDVLTVVTPPPIVPDATTLPVADGSKYYPSMRASVNPRGFLTTVYFEWGPTTRYGNSTYPWTIGAGTADVLEWGNPSPLEFGATYHYRVVAASSEGTAYGADQAFTIPPDVPIEGYQTYRDVTQSSAVLAGTINPQGADTLVHYEYGTTWELGQRTPDQLIGASNRYEEVEQLVTDLLPDTKYYFVLVAANAAGPAPNYRGSLFQTLPLPPVSPTISSVSAGAATDSAIVLSGSVDPGRGDTLVHFEYGTSETLGQSTASVSVGSGSVPVAFDQPVDALLPDTTYYFRMVAVNVAGTTTVPGGTFKTLPIPPLSAVNDNAFTTKGESRVIDVLANDTGVPRSAMHIVSVGQPSSGSVSVNSDATVTYVPGKSFVGHDSFTYMIGDDTGRTASATVTVADSLRTAAGLYDALVGSRESTFKEAGFLRINVSSTGAVTGKLTHERYALPFKTKLEKDGTAVVKLPGVWRDRFSIILSIDPATQRLSGTVVSSDSTSAFSANRIPYSAKNPAPQAGLFTIVLPSAREGGDHAGHGFATVKVSPMGAILLAGRTGNGTPFSSASHVDGNGTFPLYGEIRQSRPAKLYGIVQFRDVPGTSDCDGVLGTSESLSDAVDQIPAIGSRYVVPAPTALVLSFPAVKNNAVFEFGQGSSSLTSGPLPVTLAPRSITSQDRSLSRLTLDRKTGLFSGSLLVGGKSSPFFGVAFQRQALGMGVVKTSTGAGWVMLSKSAPSDPTGTLK